MKVTDLQMLRAILSLGPGKITVATKRAFEGMFDGLSTGKQINLSKAQREWVEKVWKEQKLDKYREPSKKIEVKDKAAQAAPLALDTMPKPLKPPGR